MRKKLTALVLSALPLAAVADVSLYGEIKAGVEGRNIQLQLTEPLQNIQPQVTKRKKPHQDENQRFRLVYRL